MTEIYSKINAIMAEIPAIGKEKFNKQQGFKYRGIDDVMNALFPLLAKHGVFAVPEVLNTSRTERTTTKGGNLAFTVATVKYTFFATDGSSVSAITTGEGMDSADKSTNKAMAAAMKYAFFQIFCIPTEEIGKDDPDAETPEESAPAGYTPVSESELNPPVCHSCGKHVEPYNKHTAQQMAKYTKSKYGRPLCAECAKQESQKREAEQKKDRSLAEAEMEFRHGDAGDRA